MWKFWKKVKKEEESVSIWKTDFSDCVTADYLPTYSVCKCDNNRHCRFIVYYEGMRLCSHPEHRNFIPEGAPRFDPHKNQFRD
ncbi:hypothetical protein SCARR_02073 [Pontiella sulfatireligans]|uniref:Uncharacterized protein n=1 Tax=Pontiella sulfatireligans TaxID=2750658 RepID=A0A6C2UJF9_9BACT|nr:hypothetical protein SCARR_02073 [Pontiella sulfatireligans]